MISRSILLLAVSAGLLLAGCGKKSDSTAVPGSAPAAVTAREQNKSQKFTIETEAFRVKLAEVLLAQHKEVDRSMREPLSPERKKPFRDFVVKSAKLTDVKFGEPAKADLVAPGSQTLYVPVKFTISIWLPICDEDFRSVEPGRFDVTGVAFAYQDGFGDVVVLVQDTPKLLKEERGREFSLAMPLRSVGPSSPYYPDIDPNSQDFRARIAEQAKPKVLDAMNRVAARAASMLAASGEKSVPFPFVFREMGGEAGALEQYAGDPTWELTRGGVFAVKLRSTDEVLEVRIPGGTAPLPGAAPANPSAPSPRTAPATLPTPRDLSTAPRFKPDSQQAVRTYRAVLSNLRSLYASFAQYCLEKGTDRAALSDLVGPQSYLQSLTPVAGETYDPVLVQGQPLYAQLPDGSVIEYRP